MTLYFITFQCAEILGAVMKARKTKTITVTQFVIGGCYYNNSRNNKCWVITMILIFYLTQYFTNFSVPYYITLKLSYIMILYSYVVFGVVCLDERGFKDLFWLFKIIISNGVDMLHKWKIKYCCLILNYSLLKLDSGCYLIKYFLF